MKCRRLLLPLPLLPTITETLEDSSPSSSSPTQGVPLHASSSTPGQATQSLEDYMSSIQALARPMESPSYGPVRPQRSPRPRPFSKTQMKLPVSALLPRGSPRSIRTGARPSTQSLNSSEEFSLRMGRERDCRGRDPVDWLFGQTQIRTFPQDASI